MSPTPAPGGYLRPVAFIDADALIAGCASSTGASHVILRLGDFGLIDLVSSAQVRNEAERNLAQKLPSALPAFRRLADAACRWVADPSQEARDALLDEAHQKDVPILAAAIEARSRWLVTFNVGDYNPRDRQIEIVRPAAFLELLRTTLEQLAER